MKPVEISKETANQFSKQLDHFLKGAEPITLDECIGELKKHPLVEVWFNHFGLNIGWLKVEQWIELIETCESPIEQILVLSLMAFGERMGVHKYILKTPSYTFLKTEIQSPIDLIIETQVPIEKYRVDFKITHKEIDSKLFGKDNMNAFTSKTILVECDGHDFHEKTKLQVSRDKARDRKLTALGYSILRFSGSEIWKDPFRCAHEIFCYLLPDKKYYREMRERSKKAGLLT